MELVFIPFLSRQRFAELVGISEDVLENWIRKGYVKCHTIGKRSLVDMRQWLDDEEARATHRSTAAQHGQRGGASLRGAQA